MRHLHDLILLLVVLCSMVGGLLWPEPTGRLAPYLNRFLMILLYLAFLKVSPQAIRGEVQRHPKDFLKLVVLKLFVLPALIYPLAAWTVPPYALGLLLLAGASTGVSAPFFAALVGAHIPLVLLLTVSTSIILPVTLPLMAKVLAGRELVMEPLYLGTLIATIIIIPLLTAGLTQRLAPQVSGWLAARTYYPSVLLIAVINLGAFGNFAPFLRAHQAQIVLALGLSTVLALVLAGFGALAGWRRQPPVRAAAAASMGWINNILVLVLGIDLGDPYISLLAALYLIPFHFLILPVRRLSSGAKA